MTSRFRELDEARANLVNKLAQLERPPIILGAHEGIMQAVERLVEAKIACQK